MPKNKTTSITEETEIQPLIAPETETLPNITKKNSSKNRNTKIIANKDLTVDTQAPAVLLPKQKFKEIHIKDTFWLENDIYQTIEDLTNGKKGAKALIVNKALKDYFKKNKLPLQSFTGKK